MRTTAERFWDKVDVGDRIECWLWTASTNRGGYGEFKNAGKVRKAHRVAYEAEIGPIPDGLHIDHLCRTRNCVNVEHMEAVTPRENGRRGYVGAIQRARTHCPRGHAYTADNLVKGMLKQGKRQCRTCVNAAQRKQ